ncbi:hypothetical protein INT45_012138 [Circinella minor]|uniref:Uncharacterized protein n=1 Tax=Circinella minor TaxID=1195481 RepID=A0A8H7VK12_9FUNG|nr:hypothetical protein INT45_012138 [Circinella minor]
MLNMRLLLITATAQITPTFQLWPFHNLHLTFATKMHNSSYKKVAKITLERRKLHEFLHDQKNQNFSNQLKRAAKDSEEVDDDLDEEQQRENETIDELGVISQDQRGLGWSKLGQTTSGKKFDATSQSTSTDSIRSNVNELPWVLNDMALAEIFMECRRKTIRKAGQLDQDMSAVDRNHLRIYNNILNCRSLNFICYINERTQLGNSLKAEPWEVMNKELKKEYKLELLVSHHVKWCHKVVLQAWIIEEEDDESMVYQDVYSSLMQAPRSNCSDDLVKLSNCLKDCINQIFKKGGDLGFMCRVVMMDSKYHVFYRLSELGTLYIPQSVHNFEVLLGTFQVMNLVKVSICVYHGLNLFELK